MSPQLPAMSPTVRETRSPLSGLWQISEAVLDCKQSIMLLLNYLKLLVIQLLARCLHLTIFNHLTIVNLVRDLDRVTTFC